MYSKKKPSGTNDDMIDLDQYGSYVQSEEPWLSDLNRNISDKTIITDDKWLTDKHMLAVTTIIKKQFPRINGLQDTTSTPF